MRRRRWWRRAAELLLVLAIAAVAAATIARAPAKQAGDEANWLGTARFFLVLFVRHDVSAEAWPDSYWTRTQPMVPRYIMGGWLWARGYEYEGLDPNFDHTKKWFTNVREGRAPEEPVLAEARLPMRGLTALAAVLLYGVVRLLAGPVGGAAAALLYCGSPYLALHLVRAMGEPPFIVFLLATLLVCLLAIQRGGQCGPGIEWGLLAGLLLGLAFASKLTAIIAIAGLLVWGAWAALGGIMAGRLRWPRRASSSNVDPSTTDFGSASPSSVAAARRTVVRAAALGWSRGPLWAAGVVLIGWLVFVGTNPFMYPDPFGRTWLLFANRQAEMAAQAAVDPSRAVPTLPERARLVWQNSLVEDTWADSRLHRPVEAVLAIVGFAWLLARAVRVRPGAESLLLLWVVGFFGGVTVGLGYVLDHYFVPTAIMGLILSGLAVGWSVQLAWALARRLTKRRRGVVSPREAVAA